MSGGEEWGPWIEHDGTGFPEYLRGRVIEVAAEQANGREISGVGIVRSGNATEHWDWSNFGKYSACFGWHWARVLRYRIRGPLALRVLINLAESPPAPAEPVEVPA